MITIRLGRKFYEESEKIYNILRHEIPYEYYDQMFGYTTIKFKTSEYALMFLERISDEVSIIVN